MMGLFVRAGIAFAAAFFAIVLGVIAQRIDPRPYTGLVAVWPAFLILVGQGVYIALKKVDDPKLAPALGALLVLPFYAAVARESLTGASGTTEATMILMLAPMVALGGLLLGVVLERFSRVVIGLAVGMTVIASLAIALPSVHRSLRPHTRSYEAIETEDVRKMPLAGVLVLDGASLVAHGVSYRMQHDAFDGTYCEVVAESKAFASERSGVVYSCKSRPLRCDDARRVCLVEDDEYATGYTYDYEPVGIHGYHPPTGTLLVRIEAELLVLGALVLLHRARTSKLRHTLGMSAFAASSLGLGMMIPLLVR